MDYSSKKISKSSLVLLNCTYNDVANPCLEKFFYGIQQFMTLNKMFNQKTKGIEI